jgi:hypothetical protein
MDYSGQIVKGKDQKVVGKLKTAKLSMMSGMEIMYLPDDSSVSRMLENLGDHETQQAIGFFMQLGLFLFSAIVVSLFCLDIL